MSRDLKFRLGRLAATGALVLAGVGAAMGGVTTPAEAATGGLDINRWCRSVYPVINGKYMSAPVGKSAGKTSFVYAWTAYGAVTGRLSTDWKCRSNIDTYNRADDWWHGTWDRGGVDFNAVCRLQYGRNARAFNPYAFNPNGWTCFY